MDAVPVSLVLAVVVFVLPMTIGRCLFVNETNSDRLINRTWGWNLAGVLVYQIVAALGHPYFAQCLYLGLDMMALASFYGLARLVDSADAKGARERQRRYDSTAAAVAASLIIGAPLAHSVFRVDYLEVVWAVSAFPGCISGLLFGRACVRELRVADSPAREKLTYALLLAFSIYWTISWPILLVRALAGTPPSRPGPVLAVVAVLMLGAITLLTAIPLFIVLLARAGWDRTGRICRRLRPLWRELTTAVPEVVLLRDPSAPREPASQLYRMTVEIWDALLHLKPYTPDAEEFGSSGMSGDEVRAFAFRAAWAVRAKRHGNAPAPNVSTRGDARAERRDRAAELEFLIGLAREWPKAVAMVGYGPDTAQAAATAAVSQ
ncbi:MAB_1171c family putative transporter [Nocardia gipuzkoensis]|uniref:MAB_1171c family putative transporter n=1 Tax=Nocardia gipuzkoensis TaxID=2749991 RepID=UPI00237EDB00|nr:MAB_1171c family putative transporter [Nocardia gipuzkoensis]MDE1671837.1 hypothetical protein [Nocardia gipuzkoensis]